MKNLYKIDTISCGYFVSLCLKGGFMSGGIIEGIKKCYTGNNVITKHIFLFIISLLVSIPSVIAAMNTNGNDSELYRYIYIQYPLLGIVSFIGSVMLGLYMIHFLRNTLKFCIWKDKQTDKEKINALQIMPEIDKYLFFKFGNIIIYWVIWLVMLIAIVICTAILCIIPNGGFIAIPLFLIFILAFALAMPLILCGFVKDFSIKQNINPLLIFKYLAKTLLPITILDLKFFGISILFGILGFIVIGIATAIIMICGILKPETIANNPVYLTAFCTLYVYISIILSLGYYYGVGHIYYNKIEKQNNTQTV